MRIRWTLPAADDLENIKLYLDRHHPEYAEPTVRAIYERIRSLKLSPNRGRPGHRQGTRELAMTLPYIVVYTVKETRSRYFMSTMALKTGGICRKEKGRSDCSRMISAALALAQRPFSQFCSSGTIKARKLSADSRLSAS